MVYMLNLIKNKQIIYYIILILVIVIGVQYRTDVWLKEAGFFGDEGALIYNIQNKSFLQLFTTLEQAQCCPVLFLIFNKLIYNIFGLNETALRFFSYFTGVLTVIFSPFLCSKIFKSKVLAVLFTSIIIYNPQALYYSQEFKQYSSDILFTMIYIYLFLILKDKVKDTKTVICAGIISGISIFLSYSVQFIVFPVLLFFGFKLFKEKNYKHILYLFSGYLIMLSICFIYTIWGTFSNGILDSWIKESFPIKNWYDFSYLTNYLVSDVFGNNIVSVLFIMGSIVLLLKNRLLFYILIAPILFNIVSGLFHLYPFAINRVIMYLLPIFTIIVLYPFDCFICKFKSNTALKYAVYIMILFCSIFLYFQKIKYIPNMKYYYYRSNAREYIEQLNNRKILSDELIFADTNAEAIFTIYDKENKYKNNRIAYMIFHNPLKVIEYSNENKIYHLDELKKGQNIYFYNTDLYSDAVDINTVNDWINKNCKILYSKKDEIGEFLYVKKITGDN